MGLSCRLISARGVVAALLLALSAVSASAELPPMQNYRTRHYSLHTDVDRDLAIDLGKRMDAMYDEYARRLANFVKNHPMPLQEVYVFKRQADYLDFTSERLRNTGGVYMAGRNILAAYLENQGRESLRRTLQHEAFHQFAHNVISPNLPVWLNEGLAQVFEEGIWTGGEFLLKPVPPRRVRQLKADMEKGRLLDFERILTLDNEQWSSNLSNDAALGATEYNQVWAMVYFLAYATDAKTGKEKYRNRLLIMLESLHRGVSSKQAFTDAFSTNISGFQDRFKEYAAALQPTREATLADNQGVLADLLAELSKRDLKVESIAALRKLCERGRLSIHYTRGQIEWTTEPDLDVYFSDPTGRAFTPQELYLDPHEGSPLPDIVCRADDTLQFRTRFFTIEGGKIEHETLVESPKKLADRAPAKRPAKRP